jgi:hypothetical protein
MKMSKQLGSKPVPAKEYLEAEVFPTLLPALEELLRWVQTHQNDKPVSYVHDYAYDSRLIL